MEIIAQAAFGISKFIHPDYVSATPNPFYSKIDFFDGKLSIGEYLILTFSITGILLLGLLIAHFISFISIKKNRS
ncbi:MAG: hypothetical protein ACTSR7_18205 [Promethearchaeota archaeon]